jgi:hypothetical protein
MNSRRIWVPGLITPALFVLGLLVDATTLMQSWLAVTLTWGLIPLGALAILMTHGLTGGRWGIHSRPVWLALVATMPLFAVSLAPLLFATEILFSWTRPFDMLPEVVQNKTLYLNEPFFILRTLFYLLLWLGLAWGQGTWARQPGRVRMPRIHAPGLILWLLSLTFFGFDWFMSLEPKFYSDVFGLMLAMAGPVAAIAVGLILDPDLGGVRDQGARRDMANLWLSVLLGWAFMGFAQYIVIWSGNLPDEIGWYLHRSVEPWRTISIVSFGLFFLVPFLVLLSGAAKSHGGWLRVTAVLCLTGHVLQVLWLVLPAFGVTGIGQAVLVLMLLFAVGATYAGLAQCYYRRLTDRHDTSREANNAAS